MGVINLLITYVENNEVIVTTRIEQPEIYLKLLNSPIGFKLYDQNYHLETHQYRLIEVEGETHEELIIYVKAA